MLSAPPGPQRVLRRAAGAILRAPARGAALARARGLRRRESGPAHVFPLLPAAKKQHHEGTGERSERGLGRLGSVKREPASGRKHREKARCAREQSMNSRPPAAELGLAPPGGRRGKCSLRRLFAQVLRSSGGARGGHLGQTGARTPRSKSLLASQLLGLQTIETRAVGGGTPGENGEKRPPTPSPS